VLNELLTQLWVNTHSTGLGPVCLLESVPLPHSERILIQNSFFVWCGLLSEKASAVLGESSFSAFGGRIRKFSTAVLTDPRGFATFMETLDEVDDIVLATLSSVSSEFKAQFLLSELHRFLSERPHGIWRLVSPIFSALLPGDELTVEAVSFLRQLACLLTKLRISREDLLASHYSEYRYSEELLFCESSVQKYKGEFYSSFISDVRYVLSPVIKGFSFDPRLARHGPGAVSDPTIKTPLGKYSKLGDDRRISYLLSKEGYSGVGDFTPFPVSDDDRVSRLIFVPKTWKKMRGISAEPAGLQFFQQAIYRSLSSTISMTPLYQVIKLSRQDASRDLARRGSRDGSLATIDLSSASDSITRQIVRDVFGTSSLCRWLLATRSTHTLVENERLELNKFAPMGSACCFPVECLIFAGITLATVFRKFGFLPEMGDFQVFGDDIICPSPHASDVMENLVSCGFTVNSDKSYANGDYRESCGMEAWRGVEITPLRLKDFSFDYDGSAPLDFQTHARTIAYMNDLYAKGYTRVRSFLLRKFLSCCVTLGKESFNVQQSVCFGSGDSGEVFTHHPSNYHLEKRPLRSKDGRGFLFRDGCKLVTWNPQRLISKLPQSEKDRVNYFIWLMENSSANRNESGNDLSKMMPLDSKPRDITSYDPNPQMIPSFRVKDPWYNWGFFDSQESMARYELYQVLLTQLGRKSGILSECDTRKGRRAASSRSARR